MKPFNHETALIDMLMSQLEFQRQLLNKRNLTAPDDVKITTTKKLEVACYHATCTNVELAEFVEQLKEDKHVITQDVLLELTDAFTFLLNQLLYINILPTKTLDYYREAAKERFEQKRAFSYTELTGLFNLAIGELYHKTRYKTWKIYSELDYNFYKLIPLVDEVLTVFMMFYVKADISSEQIYNLFYQKHAINIDRQKIGGKYETV